MSSVRHAPLRVPAALAVPPHRSRRAVDPSTTRFRGLPITGTRPERTATG